MQFRNAKKEDFDSILSGYKEVVEEFEKRVFDEAYYRKMLTRAIDEERNIVCEIDGKVVGFIEYETKCPDLPTLRENSCWIGWSWVSSKHRGTGIGRALYQHLFKILKEKKFARVGLDVMSVNLQSQRFHEKIGFEERMKIYVKEL